MAHPKPSSNLAELPEFIRLALSQTRALDKRRAHLVSNDDASWSLFSELGLWRDIPDSTTGAYMHLVGVVIVTWAGREEDTTDPDDYDHSYYAVFAHGALDIPLCVAFTKKRLKVSW